MGFCLDFRTTVRALQGQATGEIAHRWHDRARVKRQSCRCLGGPSTVTAQTFGPDVGFRAGGEDQQAVTMPLQLAKAIQLILLLSLRLQGRGEPPKLQILDSVLRQAGVRCQVLWAWSMGRIPWSRTLSCSLQMLTVSVFTLLWSLGSAQWPAKLVLAEHQNKACLEQVVKAGFAQNTIRH